MARCSILVSFLALSPTFGQFDLLNCLPNPSYATYAISGDGSVVVMMSDPDGIQTFERHGDKFLPLSPPQSEFVGLRMVLSHSGLVAAFLTDGTHVQVLKRQPESSWEALAKVPCPNDAMTCGGFALSGDGSNLLIGAGQYEVSAFIYSAPNYGRALELPCSVPILGCPEAWGAGFQGVALDYFGVTSLISGNARDGGGNFFPIAAWFLSGAISYTYLGYNMDGSYSTVLAVSGDGGTVAMGVYGSFCSIVWAETGQDPSISSTFSCSSAEEISLNYNGTMLMAGDQIFSRNAGGTQWTPTAYSFPGPGLLSADASTAVITSGCVYGKRSPQSSSTSSSPSLPPSLSPTLCPSLLPTVSLSPTPYIFPSISASASVPTPSSQPNESHLGEDHYFIPFVATACAMGCIVLGIAFWVQRARVAKMGCCSFSLSFQSFDFRGPSVSDEGTSFRASGAYVALN